MHFLTFSLPSQWLLENTSPSARNDTENADLAREKGELVDDPEFEKEELAQFYVARGVETDLARRVAQ
jgi:hypothetical protein